LAGAGPSAALRAVIADGDRFYRDGLALLLRESGIDVVGEVSTGEAALEAVQQRAPDVVIMDFDVPGLSGLEAIRRIGDQAPETGLLILSDVAQEAAVTDAIRARGGPICSRTGQCGRSLRQYGRPRRALRARDDAGVRRSTQEPSNQSEGSRRATTHRERWR
jgi:DNA-binding NarL/FixJ family response regulator